MVREYVGRIVPRGRTHAMREEWKYSSSVNLTECGLNASGVEHRMSGDGIEITCARCLGTCK